MASFNFPVYKTRVSDKRKFMLEDPNERKAYFKLKAGKEIDKLKNYLKRNTFVAFLLGKKNSGKGTYTKLFMEAVGSQNVAHISVGDIVRNVDKDLRDPKKKKELKAFLKERYRGFMDMDEALNIIYNRTMDKLLPTEMILALVEREIDKLKGKAIFVDGFPRNLDQISYSLYFRALMGYREDPDFFVFIDVPEAAIDERMKYRVICPNCKTPRNIKLLRTKEVGYDNKTKKFFLMCDNTGCKSARMVSKEGDDLGIEALRSRIELDDKIMRTLLTLKGVPHIYLRNAVPVDVSSKNVNDYEITPAYRYEYDDKAKKVGIIEEPWTFTDEEGKKSYSLLPAPVAVALIKQVAKALGL